MSALPKAAAINPAQTPSSDDDEGQQRLGVPRDGATRRGAHACAGRGREGGGAGVLCGGYSGYAEIGDGGGWRFRFWASVPINDDTTTW